MNWVSLQHCVACGCAFDERARTFQLADPWKVTRDKFRVIRCAHCKTWSLNPRPAPDEMQRFYEDGFLYSEPSAKASAISRMASKVQSLNLASEVDWVCQNLPHGGRYLDFSAGNGQILQAVAQRRPDARFSATEYSRAFRPAIKARVPGAAVYPNLETMPENARYDLISAFGVFEHVESPQGLLHALRGKLAPNGAILLSIPNPDSVQARIFGRRWYSWVAPRHFQLMPRQTFSNFAANAGLAVSGERHFFLRTAPSSLALSAFPGVDPLLRPTMAKLLLYAALFAAALPIEFAFSKIKAGGFMGFRLVPKEVPPQSAQ